MSSEFGNKIKLSIFGESHGEAIGCVIDSIPAGVKLDMEKIYFDMARRAPGKDKTATPRLEKDIPHILSGVLKPGIPFGGFPPAPPGTGRRPLAGSGHRP